MFYRYEFLSSVKLNHINNFYDFCDWVDGSRTGSENKKLKNNWEMDLPNTHSAWKIIEEDWRTNVTIGHFLTPIKNTLPLFVKYEPGCLYDWHCDNTLMGENEDVRSDVSTTVFLNNPDEYEGGELEIEIGTQTFDVKLPAGWAFSYPTGTRHRVREITSGVRKAAIIWSQSLFRNSVDREAYGRNRKLSADLSKCVPKERISPAGDMWHIQQAIDDQQMYLLRSKAEL